MSCTLTKRTEIAIEINLPLTIKTDTLSHIARVYMFLRKSIPLS